MAVPRRTFLAYCSSLGLTHTLFPGALYARVQNVSEITVEDIAHAEKIAGLSFTPEQRALMVEDLNTRLEDIASLRAIDLPNSVPPALVFDPTLSGVYPPEGESKLLWEPQPISRPGRDEDLAFMTVAQLAYLLRERAVTSAYLTELSLSRMKQYDPILQAVITLTEERARAQAAQADRELDAGHWRGPLHGIPYGAKDLLAVNGYPTTWGSVPYRDQHIELDAAVIERLDAAGAVLVAKLSLGELAWGDVWFGGTTKNPWNIEQGSSGSSAGPGSAVSAGLVPFAIGSETLGSIVSPSTRNGVTGHRPTFGTVSRYGAMALSWSMDKLGPMARSAEDCALVFHAIHGKDRRDPATRDVPFTFNPEDDLRKLRVGYYASAFEEEYDNRAADLQSLQVLREMGLDLHAVELPNDLPFGALLLTLEAESAAAFDALPRSGGVDQMVRQGRDTWPHVFRTARLIPAVEYLQANRVRTLLMQNIVEAMRQVDVVAAPSFGGDVLAITNLSGHPCVCVPNSFAPLPDQPSSPRRNPGSISFIGGMYKDGDALALAHAYQQVTDFHTRRPPIG